MWDGFRCGLIEPSLTLHRLRPYRSSNRTARRDPRSGCMPIPRPPTTLGRSDNWTMADRRLSPYRSRASPIPKLPAFTNCTINRYRARKRPAVPTTRLHCTSAANDPLKKPMILNAPPLLGAPLRVGSCGQGYEEPQGCRIERGRENACWPVPTPRQPSSRQHLAG